MLHIQLFQILTEIIWSYIRIQYIYYSRIEKNVAIVFMFELPICEENWEVQSKMDLILEAHLFKLLYS